MGFRKILAVACALWGTAPAFAVDCQNTAEEYSKAKGAMNDDGRFLALEQMHNDIYDLVLLPERHEGKPRSYWQNCMNAKVRTLNEHIKLSSDRMRDSADFHILLASNFEMRGEYGKSYVHGMTAVKKLPRDYSLRLRVFNVWLASQKVMLDVEKARNSAGRRQNMVALGDSKAFDDKLDFFVSEILKDRKASSDDRLAALKVRAAYYEALARLIDAVEDWEAILKITPKDIRYLRKLAAYELSRSRKSAAMKLLDRIVKSNPGDLGAHKKLIEMYIARREVQRAKSQLSLAMRFHPMDRDLRLLKAKMRM
jgi:tetratricopeptide (TPR) repeat protein